MEPRLNQTALALLSLIDDEGTRARVSSYLRGVGARGQEERLQSTEALIVRVLAEAFADGARVVRVAEVAERVAALTSEKFHIHPSNKAVGHIVREKLGIPTHKFHGVYGIGQEERERVRRLAERFGVPHTLPTCAPVSFPSSAEAAESPASTGGA
ncbi:MAG: hypothetical protein WDN31_02500 [Hyphomicrobium sp.]